MMISGVKFYQRKARMSQHKLAELAGVSGFLLQRMNAPDKQKSISLANYIRVAEVLRVPVSALLEQHDDSELADGDRVRYPSRTENLNSPVAVYRKRHGITLEQLGERLGGKTRACAQLACAEEHPRKKHIRVLAAYEDITPEEFCRLYAPEKEV